MLPRPPSTDQRLTCLEYQRLDFLFAHPEHGGDFLVRMIRELEENERSALVGRQPLQVIQHLAKVLPPLDHVCHTLGGWSICRHVIDIDIAAGAELRQAAVARDRIQPGPERHVGVARSQCAKRRDKRQLKRVLGRLAVSQHVRAEREHAASVSIVDRLEGSIVARTQPRNEILVCIVHDGPAIEPTAEPGDCRVHPHAHSVRYPAPKVQGDAVRLRPQAVGLVPLRSRGTWRGRQPGVGQTASRESVIPGRRAPNRIRQTEKN